MGQIAVGEANPMITNLQLDHITVTLTDQLEVPGSMGERVVQQISQGILSRCRSAEIVASSDSTMIVRPCSLARPRLRPATSSSRSSTLT